MYFSNNFVFNDFFYYVALSDEVSIKKIEEIILFNKKSELASYIFLPIIITIKFTLITILIYTGVKLFELNITFENCFKTVLFAESILLISSIVRILYFYIYPPDNFEALQYFNPLGLISLLKKDSIPKYLLYPIQQLNFFEVGYWLLLAFGIKSFNEINFLKALKITSLSYGVGLAIWSIFIVFLQLQYN